MPSSFSRANGRIDSYIEAKFAVVDTKVKLRAIIEALPSDMAHTPFLKAVMTVRSVNQNFDSVEETLTLVGRLRDDGYVEYSSRWRMLGGVQAPEDVWLTHQGAELQRDYFDHMIMRREQKPQA